MSNSVNSRQDEWIAARKDQDLRREIESIRLLRDAGLSNPGWLERLFLAIGNVLVKSGQRLRENYTKQHQPYQITSGKFSG